MGLIENSIMIILFMIPTLIMLVGLILSFSYKRSTGMEVNSLLIIVHLSALVINSVYLFYPSLYTFTINSIEITRFGYLISEFVLISGLIGSLSIKTVMNDIPQKDLMATVLIFTELGFMGMGFTSNIIIFSMFFMIGMGMITGLFHFGKYRKEYFVIKKYMIIITMTVILLFLLVGILYATTGSVALSELDEYFKNSPDMMSVFFIKLLVLIIILLGLGGTCGVFPALLYGHKEFHENSNLLTSYLTYSMQYPIFILIIIRFFKDFEILNLNNGTYDFIKDFGSSVNYGGVGQLQAILSYQYLIFALIIIIPALISAIIAGIYSFLELFRKIRGDSANIRLIWAGENIVTFNIMLIILALTNIIKNPSSPYLDGTNGADNSGLFAYILNGTLLANNFIGFIIYFIIITIILNALFYSALMSIKDERDLTDIEELNITDNNRGLLWAIVLTPLLFIIPGTLGYYLSLDIFAIISSNIINNPIFIITASVGLIIYFTFIGYIVVLNGLIFSMLHKYKKQESILKSIWKRFSLKDINFWPLAVSLILFFAIIIIGAIFPDVLLNIINSILAEI
ncbi:MAG: hypothetical protein ACTSU2_16315 [Promethearchaeota archaeon]